MEGLNQEQIEVVTHDKGPLLIIAGAGTGKTSVITRRIAYLLAAQKARQDEILALTFTDRAASEMEERVDVLVPYGYTEIWISTFHSFGDKLLRENALVLGLDPDFRVLTRPEAAVFFKEHLFKFNLSYYRPLSDPARFIEAIITYFSRLKDENISSKEYLDYARNLALLPGADTDPVLKEEVIKHTELANVFKQYQDFLNEKGMVDFGNQFYLALELLCKHPAVLARYQKKFKYILIDEFQDTNFAQFEMVKLLAGKHGNITVVADDDQCIYRFRGAAYSNILNFTSTYRKAKKITLIRNYRSSQNILDSAYRLIQHNNPDRFEIKSNINKRLIGLSKDGKEVEHFNFDTISSEADFVAGLIKRKAVENSYKYSDFAILVRSNNDADPFLRSLNMLSIPWRFSGNQGLYSKEEVRLCISFLRLAADIEDSLSAYHLLNSAIYALDIVDLSLLMHYAKRRNLSLFSVLRYKMDDSLLGDVSEKSREVISRFIVDMERYLRASRDMPTGRLLYLFLTDTGYLSSLTKNPSAANEEKICNLAKFFELVVSYEDLGKEDRVVYFVAHLSLLIEAGDDPATVEPDLDISAVQVMTLHKAKGLEFKVVFMVGLVQGRFPWPRRAEPIEVPDVLIKDALPSGNFHIQEERRLFYVGMTRAKEELYFTSSLDYGGKKIRKISQFVPEALGEANNQASKVNKTSPIEAIKRNATGAQKTPPPLVTGIDQDNEILNLSYYQIDDYMSCPLKYKYVHILRVPIMSHHTVLYGKAMHDAVLKYYQHRINKIPFSKEGLCRAFDASFRAEGFFSREHIEERRASAYRALKMFFQEEEKVASLPAYMEKEFSFFMENNKISGRWDRVDIIGDKAVIIDFKTSAIKKQKDADRKAKESLQLSIYALAYKCIYSILPQSLRLYFLDSGLIGSTEKDDAGLEETISVIKEAAIGIRRAEFPAKPQYLSCTYCAYNQICPYAAISR